MKIASLVKIASPVLLALAACGGQSDATNIAPSGGSEDELQRKLIPGVAAIEMETTVYQPNDSRERTLRTLGGKTKVAKAMRAFKKRTENDPIPLCHPGSPSTSLKFYDADGELIATGSERCRMGVLQLEGGEPIQVMVGYELSDAAEAPLVPADAIWGIDKVEIQKLQRVGDAPTGKVSITDDEAIDTVVDAMDIQQKIEVTDPNAPQPRCLPTHVVSFMRKNKDVAYTTYTCHLDSMPAKLSSRFTIPGATENADPIVEGRIDIAPRKIEEVYAAARARQH